MATRGRIQIRRSASGLVKAITEAARAGTEDAARFWHANYMPGHFTVAGGRTYGYQPRSGENEPKIVPRLRGSGTRNNPKYYWRKIRQGFGRTPLVYSGDSARAAKQNVRFTVRRVGGTLVASAVMGLPKYFYQYRTDLKTPDKADELTRTTPAEVRTLTEIVRRHMTGTMAQLRTVGAGDVSV